MDDIKSAASLKDAIIQYVKRKQELLQTTDDYTTTTLFKYGGSIECSAFACIHKLNVLILHKLGGPSPWYLSNNNLFRQENEH